MCKTPLVRDWKMETQSRGNIAKLSQKPEQELSRILESVGQKHGKEQMEEEILLIEMINGSQ